MINLATNLVSSTAVYAQGSADVNTNTGDTSGPGALRDMGSAQDVAPIETQRNTIPGTVTETVVPSAAGLNPDAGFANVGIWAISILIIGALVVWWAMRTRRNSTVPKRPVARRTTATTSSL